MSPTWEHSVPIWATASPSSIADLVLDVTVERAPQPDPSAGPVVGGGLDVSGARRIDLLVRCPDQRSGYRWTVDPEAGRLDATILRDEVASPLAAAVWTPAVEPSTRLLLRARGTVMSLEVDGVEVARAEDTTYAAGAFGLGEPEQARSRVLAVGATSPGGTDLLPAAPDGATPFSSGSIRDGVLELAEHSRGLIPAGAEWAFLRTEFSLPAEPVRATVYMAAGSPEPARGPVARAWVNDAELGMGPVRSIAEETRYDTFDATPHVHAGTNAIGIQAWTVASQRVQMELIAELTDGRILTVGTGPEWTSMTGEIAYPTRGSIGTGFYAAPREDLQQAAFPTGFSVPGFDDSHWIPAAVRSGFAALEPNPAPPVQMHEYPVVTVDHRPDGAIVLDFGSTHVGGLALPPTDVPAEVRIRLGEQLTADGDVRDLLAAGNRYDETWSLAPGHGPARHWGWRTFRYARIDALPDGIPPESVRAVGHVYPLGETTRLHCDDARLQEIFDFCAETMIQTDGNLLVDSWTREREPYEADAYLQARNLGALSADAALSSYTLDYLLRRRTWPTEWPFYLVLEAWRQYERSGDLAALRGREDSLWDLAPWRWLDPETGLVRKQEGSDGSGSKLDHDIVDWPPPERDGYRFGTVNTVVNALSFAVFETLERIESALGRGDRARRAHDAAESVRSAVEERLWDETAGTYVDGLDAEGRQLDHRAAHAAAFPLAFDLPSRPHAERAGAHLAARGMAVSVYAAPFLIEGLVRAGHVEEAYALLVAEDDRSWRGMIARGWGSVGEAWNEQVKPNLTCSHPWGASPLFLVTEVFAGVRPAAPGWTAVEVAPHLPRALNRLDLDLPTPRGMIHIRLRRDGGPVTVHVAAPHGMSVAVPGGRVVAENEWLVQG